MYTLYWAQDTGALAPQILLEEIGVEYQRIILSLDGLDQKKADFLALNPKGQVPALVLPDGTLLTESAAMMLHLGECHGVAGLLPPAGTIERAHLYRWLFFAVANIYEVDPRLYYSETFAKSSDCAESIQAKAREDLDQAWGILESQLGEGPYLLGKQYSVIDPYLLMLAGWHEQIDSLLQRCPKLKQLYDTVRERPAVQTIWSQHFPDA
jgi:glutathione S-transferase